MIYNIILLYCVRGDAAVPSQDRKWSQMVI